MFSKRVVPMSALVAIGLAFSACAGPDVDRQRASTIDPSASAASTDKLTWKDSPLAKYRSGGLGEDRVVEQELDLGRQIEESVARCMQEQGFEYVVAGSPTRSAAPGAPVELNPIEYAREYGYGDNLWGLLDADRGLDVDPNEALIAQMSESEQDAYFEAYMGAPNKSQTDTEYGAEDYGCYGLAQQEAGFSMEAAPGTSIYDDPQWADLIDSMDAQTEKARSSVLMIELNQQWSDCMAESGLGSFSTPDSSKEFIKNRSAHVSIENIAEVSPQELNELKEEEIKVAVGDYTCQANLDYEQSFLRILFGIQKEFVDNNKDRLEAFLAAMEASGQTE